MLSSDTTLKKKLKPYENISAVIRKLEPRKRPKGNASTSTVVMFIVTLLGSIITFYLLAAPFMMYKAYRNLMKDDLRTEYWMNMTTLCLGFIYLVTITAATALIIFFLPQ